MNALRLERALARSAALAGTALEVESHRTVAWHSATFSGDHHEVVASGRSGERLEQWLGRVAGLELSLPGGLVADLSLAGYERSGDLTRFTIRGVTVTTDA